MDYRTLLYSALDAKLGVAVETDDVEGLRQHLYRVRKEDGNPELMTLGFQVSPTNPNELMIVRKDATLNALEI